MAQWPAALQQRRKERRSWGWKELWIDPKRTSMDDVRFMLALYHCQELHSQWRDIPQDLHEFLTNRVNKRFRSVVKGQVDEKLKEEVCADALWGVLQRHALPERCSSPSVYIDTTLRGVWATAKRKEAKPGARSALSPEEAEEIQAKGYRKGGGRTTLFNEAEWGYSVDEVVRILEIEAQEREWVPSRDTLYKTWIKKGHRWYGKISVLYTNKRPVRVTEEGLAQLRTIIKDENRYRKLRKEAGECMGNEARKKLFQRKKKSNDIPDWEAIKSHIESRARRKGIAAPSVPAISVEEQIAERKARLAETEPGSDEWAEAHDALRQLQQGSDT